MNALSVTSVAILLAIFSGVSCQKNSGEHVEVGESDLLHPGKLVVDILIDVQQIVKQIATDVQQLLNQISILKVEPNGKNSEYSLQYNAKDISVEEKGNSAEKKEAHHSAPAAPRKLHRRGAVDVDVKSPYPNLYVKY